LLPARLILTKQEKVCNASAQCLVYLSRAAQCRISGEREIPMQATISIAAMILGAAAIILGTVGVGACKTTSELIDTKVQSTDSRLAFGWTRPIRPSSGWPTAPRGRQG
jgi:hypothetical protein